MYLYQKNGPISGNMQSMHSTNFGLMTKYLIQTHCFVMGSASDPNQLIFKD